MRNFLLILSCLLVLFPITLFPDSLEKSLHEILKEGTLEELKEACRARSLSDDGGRLDLQRRLLEYEFKMGFPQFDERVAVGEMEGIILNHADFIEYQEDLFGIVPKQVVFNDKKGISVKMDIIQRIHNKSFSGMDILK